ncbi:hypothetical protein D8B27_20415, partial [Verminephrobacter aporrectodeae subsp. tuberculatae]|nr:hypothetical protein [Verminephrobacter aporrectodeae subsp. tuberculatae]
MLADTSLTLGETTTVTIAFSEHVNGFDATDVNLTDANGTLGALTANADGKTWTATFTPTGDTQDATNTISVNLAGVTNDTGRTGAGNATSSNYTVDTTRPTATITLADRTLTAGETTIVTITFSKPVTDFDANDIVLSDANGTLGPLTTNANYTVWTATFTPTANVNDATNTIRVNLSGVTDAAGNAGVGNASSANYTVDTRDTTPPALASATVNGNQLVLTYTETNSLDAAALAGNAGFAVSSAAGTAAITVNSAVVNGAAKTVTLTLSRTVAHAETVRVSYTKPATGAVVQDAAGNDAANFSDQAVTNNTPADTTPPQLITTGDTTRPKVNGDQLVLSFDDTSNLDANPDHKPAGGAFTVLVNGVANAVTSVSVEAQAKTVTLTLSTAVSHGQTVTVAYADPTTGNDANAIQDAAGNDAASFAATAVTNNTPAPADTTPPQLITTGDTTRPKVTGNQLVLSFSDTGNLDGDPIHKPASGAFTVLVNGVANAVTTVTVQSRAKTVTLTLSTAVTHGQSVTVAYTDPTTGNDTNAIQDYAGNDAASFAATEVTNNTPAPPDTTPPQLITTGDTTRPKVTGDQLVLSFSDTGNLDADATHKPAGGAFTVLVNGVANAVTHVSVEAQAKTVTLTLSTAVSHGQTVTVAYADPTTGNDTNAIQDTAGNDAASFAATAVTNNTPAPADTTPPQLITTGDTTRPKVSGDQLVLSFSDTGNLDADPTHKPANGAFTVLVNGVANAVTHVSVEAQAKTVTLTLSTAVSHGQTVTVAYADPTTGNDTNAIQDAAGNDAASFAATAVTNNTPAPPDTTPPVIHTARVTSDQLVLTYTEANSLNAAALTGSAGYAVSNAAGTAAITVNSAVVNATAKTVTLMLSRIVAHGETLSLSYARPESGTVVQDAAGNAAASFSNQPVTNATRDTTPPRVIQSGDKGPRVNGDQLVLSFNDTSNLDADPTHKPANEDFTVLMASGGARNNVTQVLVNAQAKTITLTLTSHATLAQMDSIDYNDSTPSDTSGIRDEAQNSLGSFSITLAPDTQPPTLAATDPITIGDNKLARDESTTVTIRFSEAITNFSLDDLTAEGSGARLSNLQSTDGGTTWTVTLAAPTLDDYIGGAISSSTNNKIRVNLAGITDLAGNAGVGTAASTVRYDIDLQDPVATITLADSTLTAGETTTVTFRFNEAVTNFDASKIELSNANGTLGSLTAGADGKTWTATFTPSANINDASNTIGVNMSGVRDQAGNSATGTITSANYTVDTRSDTTAPEFSSAAVNGNELVLTYTEAGTLDPAALAGNAGFTVSSTGTVITVNSAVVNATAKTVTLTLSRAVTSAETTVTVSYTKPTSGAVVQDAAGNDAADFSAKPVTNSTPAPADNTAPEFSSATVNGNELVLTYTEAGTLDPAALAGNAGFTVSSTGTAITVNSAVVNATAKTVTLTLSRAVTSAETVTVSYTKPTSGAVVQDAAGNDAADFSAKPVTNSTPAPADTTAPEFSSAAVNGNELVLTYTEAGTLDPAALAGNAGFTVSSTGTVITVNSAVVNATAKTVTLTLSRAVTSAETVTVSYTKPTSGAVV